MNSIMNPLKSDSWTLCDCDECYCELSVPTEICIFCQRGNHFGKEWDYRFDRFGLKRNTTRGKGMKFAFIVPEAHLDMARVSNAHLVLTKYWQQSKKYRKFYMEMRERGDFIILDNSIHEYDYEKSDGWEIIEPILQELEPQVASIPETLEFDADDIVSSLEFIETFREVNEVETEFLWVPRSTFMQEVIDEFHIIEDEDVEGLLTWVGLHKDMEQLAQGNTGGRLALLLALQPELERYRIWMFGSHKSPTDEAATYKDYLNVFGNDSSKPWRFAAAARSIWESRPYPPDFDFNHKIDSDTEEFVAREFVKFARWVENGVV